MNDQLIVERLQDIRICDIGLRRVAANRIKQLTAERDRLREALLCGRRLWAIARDDRVQLLIQLEQCEKRHE